MGRSSLQLLPDTIALGPDRQGCLPPCMSDHSPGLWRGGGGEVIREYSLWGYIYKVAMLWEKKKPSITTDSASNVKGERREVLSDEAKPFL